MVRTQVYLTEAHKQGLERLATATGRRQSELIREALDGYLARKGSGDCKEALAAVRGMWADRDDLDDLVDDLRGGWDRRRRRRAER